MLPSNRYQYGVKVTLEFLPPAMNVIDSLYGTNNRLMKHQYARTISMPGQSLLHQLCIYIGCTS